MRPTTILRRLLGVTRLHVENAHVAADGPLRSGCGRRGGGHGAGRAAVGRRGMTGGRGGGGSTCRGDGRRSGCSTRRGGCPAVTCGVRVERVSWAVGNSAFTAPLEELTAYLAQVTDRTTVSRVLGISWPAVG